MQNKSVFFILILFFLVSCGPVYHTTHDYYPPESMDGRYCLNSCDETRQNCTSNCLDREQKCEESARAMGAKENDACYRRKEYCSEQPEAPGCSHDMYKNCENYSNSYSQCKNKSCQKNCTEYYNRCFTNCGGEIDTKTVCVSGCD